MRFSQNGTFTFECGEKVTQSPESRISVEQTVRILLKVGKFALERKQRATLYTSCVIYQM